MSLMINGEMHEDWLESETEDGEFVRKESQFRNWITPDGSPGPSGEGGFAAEPGRYHLYICYACPWAHRTLIFRKLKQLEDLISVDVVHPYMDPKGWHFDPAFPGATPDTVNGKNYLYEVYARANPNYTGIITVPTLWDKKQQTIVNNESAEIIRMFNSAFNELTGDRQDFYPPELHEAIDAINAPIYDTLNNGVYRCGFAQTQAAYDKAYDSLFSTLEMLEDRLAQQRYLVGDRLTEADWRLFPTLIRFDAVYYSHFKCNKRRIIDYPNLSNYMRELYQYPGIRDTVNLDHIKYHYYASHESINPTGIVPKGPELDFDAAHDRNRFSKR